MIQNISRWAASFRKEFGLNYCLGQSSNSFLSLAWPFSSKPGSISWHAPCFFPESYQPNPRHKSMTFRCYIHLKFNFICNYPFLLGSGVGSNYNNSLHHHQFDTSEDCLADLTFKWSLWVRFLRSSNCPFVLEHKIYLCHILLPITVELKWG